MSDYKNTVYLPKTSFSMRAGLPKKEPEILKFWERIDIYNKLRNSRKGKELFVLHDGPPYANGSLHIGHALNKILKDIINRSQSMLGKDANYGNKTVGEYIHRPQFELFDIAADPDETTNLAESVGHQDVLEKYKNTLKQMQKEMEDPWIMKWNYE